MGVQGYAITHGQTLGTIDFQYAGDDYILQMTDIKIRTPAAEIIDVTSMLVQPTATAENYGNKKKLLSVFRDPGSWLITVLHDGTQSIPLSDWQLNGPDTFVLGIGPYSTDQQTYTAFGYINTYEPDGPMDGKALTATLTIEITDAISGMDENDDTGAVSVSAAT